MNVQAMVLSVICGLAVWGLSHFISLEVGLGSAVLFIMLTMLLHHINS